MSKQSINLSQNETKARYQSQFYLFECFSVIALTGASLIFLLVFLIGLSIALNGGEHLSRIIEMLVRTLFSEKIMSMAFAAVMLTRVAVVFTRKAKKDLEGAI